MFDKRLGIHTAYEATLREIYGADVFAAPFPLAKDFKEAVAARHADQPLQAEVGRGEGDDRPSPTSCSSGCEAIAGRGPGRRVA